MSLSLKRVRRLIDVLRQSHTSPKNPLRNKGWVRRSTYVIDSDEVRYSPDWWWEKDLQDCYSDHFTTIIKYSWVELRLGWWIRGNITLSGSRVWRLWRISIGTTLCPWLLFTDKSNNVLSFCDPIPSKMMLSNQHAAFCCQYLTLGIPCLMRLRIPVWQGQVQQSTCSRWRSRLNKLKSDSFMAWLGRRTF
jgi:hypothetical protein